MDNAIVVNPTNRDAIFGSGTPAPNQGQPVIPATAAAPIDQGQGIPPAGAAPVLGAAPATDQQGAGQQPASQQAQAQSEPIKIDVGAFLKEKWGFDNEEVAHQQIERWRALESAPPKSAEPQFSSDFDKRIYEYVTAGKEDELRSVLNNRAQVKDVDTKTNEEKIKLFMKMNNPLLDDELIEYQYARDYAVDESPFKDDDGNVVDPIGLRLAKANSTQKLQNDIAKANEFFTQFKSKIELTPLQQQQQVDEGYQQYLKAVETEKQRDEVTFNNYSKLNATDIELKFSFNDEASKINFESNFVPDADSFNATRENCLNWDEYLGKTYYSEDGSPQIQKFMRDQYVAQNFDKIAGQIQTQAVNATIKWFLEKQKTGNPISAQRNYQLEPTTADKNKSAIFGNG